MAALRIGGWILLLPARSCPRIVPMCGKGHLWKRPRVENVATGSSESAWLKSACPARPGKTERSRAPTGEVRPRKISPYRVAGSLPGAGRIATLDQRISEENPSIEIWCPSCRRYTFCSASERPNSSATDAPARPPSGGARPARSMAATNEKRGGAGTADTFTPSGGYAASAVAVH